MNNIKIENTSIILPKEISDVPYSRDVEYITFSRVFNKLSASYKIYWFLGILDEIMIDNSTISFKKLISRMIAYAWYPITAFKLSFGYCDNLGKVVNYIADNYNIASNCDEKELREFVYKSEDKALNKMIKDLTYNVPYRFLAPFFDDKTKGQGSKVENIIEQLSNEDPNCIYAICKNENNEKYIKIRENWCEYFKYNYKILKGWAYYKLVCFIQKRNPNTPAIAMKLEAPKKRDLKAQTGIWKKIIEQKHILDIYTNEEFTTENYKKYGVLSIDHFVPWSFVLHDQMWNLVPTFKNINSKKSDYLLSYDSYIDKFCNLQYEAFSFVVNNNKSGQVEEYRELLKIPDAKEFLTNQPREVFYKMINKEIFPVYNIAVNQGFRVSENMFYENKS